MYPLMRNLFRVAAVFLLPLFCFQLSKIPDPSPAVLPSPTAALTATSTPVPTVTPTATLTKISRRIFSDGFGGDCILEETDRMEKSASPDWWVNSGGWFVQADGAGSTWIGDAPSASRWRQAYRLSNPSDTDQGAHPQNLFRLITRSVWSDPEQQVYFRIRTDNLSPSANRNASNGVLLFSRYIDGDNLYYAGVRVDGYAVIKKKTGGAYTTLAETLWFPGTYDRAAVPNLIPHGSWIGLRTVIHAEGNVLLFRLYIDPDQSGFWSLALQVEDTLDPSNALSHPGYAGIRTDFMDVEFDDYSVEEPVSANKEK
jgi:hypothetical protein